MSHNFRRAGLFLGLAAAGLLATACTTYDSYGYYDQGDGYYDDGYYNQGYSGTGYIDDGYYGAGYYGDGYYYSGGSIIYSQNVYYPTRTGWLNRHNRNYRHRDARPYTRGYRGHEGYRGVPPRYRDQRGDHHRRDRGERHHRRDRDWDRGDRGRVRGEVRTDAALQRGSHNGYRNRGNRDQRNRGQRGRDQRSNAGAVQQRRQAARQARAEARVSRREALQTQNRAERGNRGNRGNANRGGSGELLGGRGRPRVDPADRTRGVVIP